jgi:uncharacterized protein (DUF362 family)/Pyruvate/2-oxoacid:ferredoxin oxidoreductase delta subunit
LSTDVSIIQCKSYEQGPLKSALTEALALIGGIESFVKANERVLIKPNLVISTSKGSAVTTNPELIGVIIDMVRSVGAHPIVGDSPGIESAKKVAESSGLMDVVRDKKAEFIELSTPVNIEYRKGKKFKRFVVAKEALDADKIINVAKLKTHAQMYLTMGVKNIFGCVPGKRKAQWHFTAGVDTDSFADMLLDLYNLMNPALTVLDGVTSMEGNGPTSGDSRETGFLLASSNAIALDHAAALLICADPKDVPILKRAMANKLSGSNMDDINILGQDNATQALRVSDFNFPPLVSTNFVQKLPDFIERRLRKSISSRPHIESTICTLCNICVSICPTEVMTNIDEMGVKINYDGCIRCFCCQEMCPHRAITVKEGWLKRLIPGI